MNTINLAIVGYRNYNDYDSLCKYIKEWKLDNKIDNIDTIISGGCVGVDTLAEKYAKENNIKLQIYYPNWEIYGKSAGAIRNKLIVNDCTHLLALLHPKSRGTCITIKFAEKKKKHIKIININ